MPDKHYYVSAQNGSDTNDGLTPSTAWKTLTRAAKSIVPATDGYTYVHIGPGVYRERFVSPSGPSATAKIIWAGDPYCQYLTNDKPGRVRITGCDTNEYPTTGKVLDWSGCTNVELWDVEVDGSLDDYAVYNVEVCRRVYVTSYNGFYFGVANSKAYDCIAIAVLPFKSGSVTGVEFHRCIAIGSTPFSGASSYRPKAYNCVSIGGYYRHFEYCDAYFCTAIGGYYYLGGGDSTYGFSYGCLGINTTAYGVRNLTLFRFLQARDNFATYVSGVPSGTTANCRAAPHVTINYNALKSLLQLVDTVGMPDVFVDAAYLESTSATMTLASERISPVTPSGIGTCYGASILLSGKTSSGRVTVELQKYVGTTWVTQASATRPVSELIVGTWNDFFWDTITGDTKLTAVSNTWRLRITADADAAATSLYGSSSTPSFRLWYMPDSLIPAIQTDLNGLTRYYPFKPGAVVAPNVQMDYTEYYATFPSIRIIGAGEIALELPAKGGEPLSVSYYVKHTGAASGQEPQLKVRGITITEQVATHTAGANVWQKLEVTVTPQVDAVLTVILSSRDNAATVFFSDPYVS